MIPQSRWTDGASTAIWKFSSGYPAVLSANKLCRGTPRRALTNLGMRKCSSHGLMLIIPGATFCLSPRLLISSRSQLCNSSLIFLFSPCRSSEIAMLDATCSLIAHTSKLASHRLATILTTPLAFIRLVCQAQSPIVACIAVK